MIERVPISLDIVTEKSRLKGVKYSFKPSLTVVALSLEAGLFTAGPVLKGQALRSSRQDKTDGLL